LADKEDKKKSEDSFGRIGMRWMGAGIEFCGVIVVFCYMGYKLDQHFNTRPILLLTGFFISFVGMVYLFYKDSKE
jgi:F0F1-type ATP synthase assembly protein I